MYLQLVRYTQASFFTLLLLCVSDHSLADGLSLEQSPSDIGAIMQQTAQKVLSGCNSWPPKVASNARDQASGKNLNDATATLVNQLTRSRFGFDQTVKPYVYNASFLRLLDSVNTVDPAASDSQLLGLARLLDPTHLHLWGTNLSIVKYDCLSMLSTIAQANANYAIPLVSLDAAFKATSGITANQSSVFMTGLFQSPFDLLYTSSDPEQRLLAAFRAIQWRLQSGNSSSAPYIATGQFLTATDTSTNSTINSAVGNFRAGLQIPFIKLNGEVAGQLSTSMQGTAESYVTYFWNQHIQFLPEYSALSSTVARSLPSIVVDSDTVGPGTTVNGGVAIAGWPDELCDSNDWTIAAWNAHYQTPQLTMTKNSSTTGVPSCVLSLHITASPTFTGDIADPKLSLASASDPAIVIPLHLNTRLGLAGKPRVVNTSSQAGWTVLRDAAGIKTFLQWSIQLHVDPPDGRVLQAVAIVAGSFKCKPGDDASSWEITQAQFPGLPPTQQVLGGTQDVALNAMLSLQGVRSYVDVMPSPPYRKTCLINGTFDISSKKGASVQKDRTNFEAGPFVYPEEVVAAPSTPSNLKAIAGSGQITLSWAAMTPGTTYAVYRAKGSDPEVRLQSNLTAPQYLDSGLSNGVTYSYTVTAANGPSESSHSALVTATPAP